MVGDNWYYTARRPNVRDRFDGIPRQTAIESCYQCGGALHYPLHGNRHPIGEKHMRTDNCARCTQRIVSLYTGYAWDEWRTVSSVRPSTVIEEWPY